MRKLFVPLLCACLLLIGCGQLPQAREMGDMALLRTVGVDREGEKVTITASTGPRARGIQGEEEPALTLSAGRDSLSAAALAIQGQSDSYVFFGYVDQLLLGEELARQSVLPVLDWFARDVELSLGAQLWVVRGDSAQRAVDSGGEEGVDSRLSTLRTDGRLGVAAISRTAGEVYTDLLERGCAYAPALLVEDGGASVLQERGYAVFKGEALAGFLDGEAARGLELLAGRPELDALEAELESGQAVAEITGARVTCRTVRQEWRPETLAVTCRVEARLAEHGGALSAAEREGLEAFLRDRERSRIEAAVEQLKVWGADCIGLGGGEDWNRRFGQMEAQVEVEIILRE